MILFYTFVMFPLPFFMTYFFLSVSDGARKRFNDFHAISFSILASVFFVIGVVFINCARKPTSLLVG